MKNNDEAYILNSRGRLVKCEEYDSATMVLRTLTPEMAPTESQIEMIEEAGKFPVVYEEDSPELTPEMVSAFQKAARERNLRLEQSVCA